MVTLKRYSLDVKLLSSPSEPKSLIKLMRGNVSGIVIYQYLKRIIIIQITVRRRVSKVLFYQIEFGKKS